MDKKKYRRKMIVLAIPLVVTLVVLVSATIAWFAINRVTNSDGMQIQIDSTPNLVISDSTSASGGIQDPVITEINVDSPFAVTFAANGNTYEPSTHDNDYTTYSTGLKVITLADRTPQNIGVNTGVYSGNSYENATTANYIDYVVYVASHAAEMADAKMTATITSATKIVNAEEIEITAGTLMATSIDIYKNSVSSANYLGTTNVATKTPVYVLGDANNTGTVPHNTEGYLTFVLRCYFDGALENNGVAYIKTSALDTSTVTLNVKFEVQ